jgi:ABC-2 type transport system permease protein
MIPILLASFQEQFDLGIILRFPVRFGSYYLLYLVFGLLDISTILGGLCCVGIFVGMAVARPSLIPLAALALVVFAAFNIFLVRAIFAWIERWLAQRKTREILGAVFMLCILGAQLLNPALYQKSHSHRTGSQEQAEQFHAARDRFMPLLKTANAVQQWLPPGLAAQSLRLGAGKQLGASLAAMVGLAFYSLIVGSALALRLKAEYRGENLSVAPKRETATAIRSKAGSAAVPSAVIALPATAAAMPVRSATVDAIVEKDIRALMRTLPLLWAVGAPLIMMVILSGTVLKNMGTHAMAFPLALPICLVYAQLGFTQIFYNNLGTEGPGIQLYFLAPIPFSTVMLAKNLLHSVLFALVATLALVMATLRLGTPDPAILVATIAWLIFALPCHLTAGNLFSLKMAYKVNPGRISRQRGSQANALLSLLVQIGFLALAAFIFWLTWFLDRLWLAVPIFLMLAVAAWFAWNQVLSTLDTVAYERRTDLMTTLMKES